MEGPESQPTTFDILKDCVAYEVIKTSKEQQEDGKGATKSRLRKKRLNPSEEANTDHDLAEELDEFVLYLAQEIYQVLPENLISNNDGVDSTKASTEEFSPEALLEAVAVPPTFAETLTTYSLVNTPDAASELFHSILSAFAAEYISQQSFNANDVMDERVPPPGGWKSTRTTECEICTRAVPLTYHHLIPRSTHSKVLKRKWHPETRLNSVAWLCRQCHSAVHKTASNEVLAREYYTVELLLQVESLQRWATWASRQRWGARRG
jgi:5-methylcytosine-specific restriction endonuclease McrA